MEGRIGGCFSADSLQEDGQEVGAGSEQRAQGGGGGGGGQVSGGVVRVLSEALA